MGDLVHDALARVGVTPERVIRWLGDCGCCDRQEKLNQLGAWAKRVVAGRLDGAVEYLRKITDEN